MASTRIPLGEPADNIDTYTPSLLYAMERSEQRKVMAVPEPLPFKGEDVWTAYELSWLNKTGRPHAGVLQVDTPCTSPCIIESKSFKLYLNSFAQTRFANKAEVLRTLNSDLAIAFRAPVMVEIMEPGQLPRAVDQVPGVCVDGIDVVIDNYERNPQLLELEAGDKVVKETLHCNTFRTLCPVTGQPDFATVIVEYRGRPIVRASMLRYLVSFRCHQAFHESTIEQIFLDIKARCEPEQLSVYGRFLRRGGIEINPFRSDVDDLATRIRLPRQ